MRVVAGVLGTCAVASEHGESNTFFPVFELVTVIYEHDVFMHRLEYENDRFFSNFTEVIDEFPGEHQERGGP